MIYSYIIDIPFFKLHILLNNYLFQDPILQHLYLILNYFRIQPAQIQESLHRLAQS
jgi:hypothetical protein